MQSLDRVASASFLKKLLESNPLHRLQTCRDARKHDAVQLREVRVDCDPPISRKERRAFNALAPQIKKLARRYAAATSMMFIGRALGYPIAMEGALKLKEISYIHAEGYPAAEMKHGPIALVDESLPVVFVAPTDAVYHKVVANMQEVKARSGQIIAVTTEDNTELDRLADHVLRVPAVPPLLSPIVTSIPLQLLAYYLAVQRGCDVDRPRNLAKSVTVE